MSYNGTTFRRAKDVLSERRFNAEKTADQRREILYNRLPRLKEIDREISNTSIKTAKIVLNGGNVTEEMSNLRDRNLALQSEYNKILIDAGYPQNILEPHYICSKCNDTGYVEQDGKSIMCSCFHNILISIACEELNAVAPLSLCTFESFNLDYYDKTKDADTGVSSYFVMSKVYDYCIKYAKEFSVNSENILMKGNTGLGKTHLSLAIANEVLRKGYGVIYVSAPVLLQRLEKNYFSSDKSDDIESLITNCDLLIIDDLGTEFHNNFSSTQLYNICNNRMLKGKPIIISTNLSPEKMKDEYSERFVSRIFGNAQRLDFIGNDIRILKK